MSISETAKSLRSKIPIRLTISYNEKTEKYEVRVMGVTSGCELHFGDGDIGSISWQFDAHRFEPYIER